MRGLGRTVRALLLGVVASPVFAQEPPQPQPQPAAAAALAVIVHPDNPVRDVTFAELRAYFLLDRQFWSDGSRTVLYLRPATSDEMKVLHDKVYGKDANELRAYWRGRLFRGEIPAKPASAPTAAAAIERVRADRAAFTVVLANELPESGVKVLTIDGRKPGDAGYSLGVPPAPRE